MLKQLKVHYKNFTPWPFQKFIRRSRYSARMAKAVFEMPLDTLTYAHTIISLLPGQFPRNCPICGYSGYFRAFGYPPRFDAQCGQCGSLERHRLMFLSCLQNGVLENCDTVLHFAPEPILRNILSKKVRNYITADIEMSIVDRSLNIEKIDMESGQIDAVICNHVLEHVNDHMALSELYRILKSNGILLCMVPIVEGWEETYENDSVSNDVERILHFGQNDHVRYYGRDFRERNSEAGFIVDEITAYGEEVIRFELMRGKKVFDCRKLPTQ